MSGKVCNHCNSLKELISFHIQKDAKDGRKNICKECKNKSRRDSYSLNKEKEKEVNKKWKIINKDRKLKKDFLYRIFNKEKINKYQSEYRKKNPDKHCANQAMRRARKDKATPPWLTEEHKLQIFKFYEIAKHLSEQTGIQHDVDHIMPLRGKKSCGLHVPWNLQILTKSDNCKKSNKEDLL